MNWAHACCESCTELCRFPEAEDQEFWCPCPACGQDSSRIAALEHEGRVNMLYLVVSAAAIRFALDNSIL